MGATVTLSFALYPRAICPPIRPILYALMYTTLVQGHQATTGALLSQAVVVPVLDQIGYEEDVKAGEKVSGTFSRMPL